MEEEQIKSSDRVGRVGSANAAEVIRIANKGCITDSDHELLALISGQKENKEISTAAMQVGLDLEDTVFQILQTKFQNAVSNPYYESEKLTKKYGVRISNHIDFQVETADSLIWIEHKSFKNVESIDAVSDRITQQMAWHYMLLLEKAKAIGKKPVLMLSYYDTTEYDGEFDASKLVLKTEDTKGFNSVIKNINKGLKIISDALPTFVYVPKEELSLDSVSLPVEMQEYFTKLKDIRFIIENAKKEEEIFKEKINSLMEEKNVKKIELIDLGLTLTRVLPMTKTTFDSKAFQKDRPKVYEKYLKQSQQKGSVRLKWKDNDN